MNTATVDPAKVFLCTPTHDGTLCTGYTGGALSSGHLFGGVAFIVGTSHVQLARDLQARAFLRQPQFEWLLSIDADIGFSRADLQLLYEGDSLLRVAEYSKKNFKDAANQFGMGFVLIHRSVFTALDEVALDDGVPLVDVFPWQGEMVANYFPSGVLNAGHWMGEDHGFFMLAKVAGIIPRVETRTRLVHWGRHGYEYAPPELKPAELPQQS